MSNGRMVRARSGSSGLHKQRGISGVAEQCMVSQGPCSVELVMIANCLRRYHSLHVSFSIFVSPSWKLASFRQLSWLKCSFTKTEELSIV